MNYFNEKKATTQSPSFLPSYLLGGNCSPQQPQQHQPRTFANSSQEHFQSPTHAIRSRYSGSQFSTEKRRSDSIGPSAQSANRHSLRHHASENRHSMKGKSGAPPTDSLFSHHSPNDTNGLNYSSSSNGLFSPRKTPEINDVTFNHNGIHDTPYVTPGPTTIDLAEESAFSPRLNSVPQSPAQMDPFYSQCESLSDNDILDACTVTVFGFPPSGASFVLQQFSLYGTISKKKIPNSGNWMHLQYQTKLQAKKALSKNGKILQGDLMIGVKPCIEMDFLQGNRNDTTTPYFSQHPSPATTMQRPPNDSMTSPRPASMRPLTAAYAASSSDRQVERHNSTPHKQTGVVAKALDYMLGW